MNNRKLKMAFGMLVPPLILAAIWSLPLQDHAVFERWIGFNLILAFVTFSVLAAISHLILRAFRLHAAWHYFLVMFGVTFVAHLLFSLSGLNGLQALYYARTQVVEDGSLTAAGALLKLTEALQAAALYGALFLMFWLIAAREPRGAKSEISGNLFERHVGDGAERIEAMLGVVLPADYRALISQLSSEDLEEYGLFDADTVIARTKEQRSGFGGASPWPSTVISIGDQDDACPYALNCTTGEVTQTDHGDLARPLAQYRSVADLIKEQDAEIDVERSHGR